MSSNYPVTMRLRFRVAEMPYTKSGSLHCRTTKAGCSYIIQEEQVAPNALRHLSR